MSRPTSSRSRPSLSLSPILIARADAFVAAHPTIHRDRSALVDAALLSHLDALEARVRYDAARPLPPEDVAHIQITVDHGADPEPFRIAARHLYPGAARSVFRRSPSSDVCGTGCQVIGAPASRPEAVWATEQRLTLEGWRRSVAGPPDWQRPRVLAYCQQIGAPAPAWAA